jgi:hypothetical protein
VGSLDSARGDLLPHSSSSSMRIPLDVVEFLKRLDDH